MSTGAHYSSDRLSEAVSLSRKGWTHQRIADLQGVARETVTRHLGDYHRELARRLLDEGLAIAAGHVEILQDGVAALIEQWERSCKDAESITSVSGQRPGINGGEFDETRTTVEGRYGDPRLQAQILAHLAEIRKIVGFESVAQARADEASETPPRIVIPDRDDRFDPDPESDGAERREGGHPPPAADPGG